MADFLTGEYLFGEAIEIAEGAWTNKETGKTDPYKNLLLLVPQPDRTVTMEKIKLPLTFNNTSVAIGKFYGIPVLNRPISGERNKLSRRLREGAPIMPAPTLNNKAA